MLISRQRERLRLRADNIEYEREVRTSLFFVDFISDIWYN